MFEKNTKLTKFEKNFLAEFLDSLDNRREMFWEKRWEHPENLKPRNAFTNRPYSGLNAFFLFLIAFDKNLQDPRFATFVQANKNGYRIAKGSSGIPIQFFTAINIETKKQWDDREFKRISKSMSEEEIKMELKKKKYVSRLFHVFSVKDLISIENNRTYAENNPLVQKEVKLLSNDLADSFEKNLVNNMGVSVVEESSRGAFYVPSEDKVVIPEKNQFNSYEARFSTLLHELGHATGHESRLNRNLNSFFGTEEYSLEELRVEINSVFMTKILGLNLSNKDKTNHLLYLDSWGDKIRQDPKAFLSVLRDSLEIKDYMLDKGGYENIFLSELNSAKELPGSVDPQELTEVHDELLNIDYKLYTTKQKEQISLAFVNGLSNKEIECFINPDFSWEQMKVLRIALEKKAPLSRINTVLDPSIPADKMQALILDSLELSR